MIDDLEVDDVGTAWFGDTVSMRWVLIHMVEETARHAGHIDILLGVLYVGRRSVKASVAVAQIPVSWDTGQNLATIAAALADVERDEIVVLPEGALSGYGDDLSALDTLDRAALAEVRERLADLAEHKGIHLFCGSLHFEDGAWWNTAQYFSPHGDRWIYRKVNLATHERGSLAAGSELATLPIRLAGGELAVGVQICREIRFPEQWQHLAASGIQVFVYLTHAVNRSEPPGVWRSHLISRAAENQRFLLASNVADPFQHCPSMIISPRGEPLAEAAGDQVELLRTTIDLTETTDWYLGQRRHDVVPLSVQAADLRNGWSDTRPAPGPPGR